MTDTTDEYGCTLDTTGAQQRLPQVHGLTERLRHRERVDDRLRLHFEGGDDTVELVQEFVRDETQCCSFFTFDVRQRDGEVVLELTAPPQASHMLDAAMASFDPALDDRQRLELFHEHTHS